jgi:hypothetical protein
VSARRGGGQGESQQAGEPDNVPPSVLGHATGNLASRGRWNQSEIEGQEERRVGEEGRGGVER